MQFELIQKYSDEFNLTQSQVYSLLSEFKGLLFLNMAIKNENNKGMKVSLIDALTGVKLEQQAAPNKKKEEVSQFENYMLICGNI